MSTPEQPLTRRQLKEMRRTGALPVVDPAPTTPADESATAGDAGGALAGLPKAAPVTPPPAAPVEAPERADASPAAPEPSPQDAPAAAEPAPSEPAASAPSAPAAAPARPLTRRQARQLRTNEIRVGEPAAEPAAADPAPSAPEPAQKPEPQAPQPAGEAKPGDAEAPAAAATETPAPDATEPPQPRQAAEEAIRLPAGFTDAMSGPQPAAPRTEQAGENDRPKVGASFGAAVFQQAEERQRLERERAAREAQQRREAAATATVRQQPAPQPADENELFAEAFQRSLDAGGSTTATGTSLVLHDMPGTASLSAPITATGELMITSSHVLPAGLASRGAAAGTTDGKDIDATLMDGEIPLHSSPTPIAASSAVSTSKAPGDVIRPPQREKNHGLMLTLGIVVGVLGVGLAGILIYAFATGVFG